MFISIVKPFGSFLKHLKIKGDDLNIYDNVFKMHTKLTVAFLLVFSLLVSAQELFGNPINCIVGKKVENGDNTTKLFAEQLCWINGTFIYRNVKKCVNGHVTSEEIPEYQSYYQWITIVLLLQAILCYIPAYIWKGWEHGHMKLLCTSVGTPVLSKKNQNQKNLLIGYLTKNNSRIHGIYVRNYIICEGMNFLIVVLNMLFLNVLFNQFWIRYLPAVKSLFTTGGETFSSLASELFPKVAKCTFSHIGPSGTTQIRDAFCLLSLNILNDKIFAFLYIWFAILLVVSGCNLIKQSTILVSSALRLNLLGSLAMSTSVPLTKYQLQLILHPDNIGDWFILYKLGQNLNSMVFRDILDEIANEKMMRN